MQPGKARHIDLTGCLGEVTKSLCVALQLASSTATPIAWRYCPYADCRLTSEGACQAVDWRWWKVNVGKEVGKGPDKQTGNMLRLIPHPATICSTMQDMLMTTAPQYLLPLIKV